MFGALLHIACPQCSRKLPPAEGFRFSTSVYNRKCPKCKSRWRLVVRPHKTPEDRMIHTLDWCAMPPLPSPIRYRRWP